jgi:hypothetical protein
MDPITLLMPFFSGAAGGNLIGGILKNFNLGSLGNSLAGMIGGGVGSLVLGNMLGLPMPTGGVDPDSSAILGQILGGGAGGGILTIIISMLQKTFGQAAH